MEILKNYFQKVEESAHFLRKKVNQSPQLVLVLSGGLSSFVSSLENSQTLCSTDIPHFPQSRVEGHRGEIVFGTFQKLPIAVLKGRQHYYEGHSPQEVVFPYFVLQALGARSLVTTNAVGGIRSTFNTGDVVVIEDHINMMGTNPLIGLTIQKAEDQFPSMQKAYDPSLITLAKTVAKKQKLKLKQGIFLAVSGPSYETPAEIKAFRKMGADCVGMSTVFEVIAARFLKMQVLTFSIITNPSADRHKGIMKHEEVLRAMQRAEGKVIQLLRGVVSHLAKHS